MNTFNSISRSTLTSNFALLNSWVKLSILDQFDIETDEQS